MNTSLPREHGLLFSLIQVTVFGSLQGPEFLLEFYPAAISCARKQRMIFCQVLVFNYDFSWFLSRKYKILTSNTFFRLNMEDPKTD